MNHRNLCLALLLGAFIGTEAAPSYAQFFFRHDQDTITVAPGAGDHPNKPIPAALSITSRAYYHRLGAHHRDRQAKQENQIRIGGSQSARAGHTIRAPFYQNQLFVCGPQPSGLHPLTCSGSAYYVKPRCPARLYWEGDAEVRTQRGYLNSVLSHKRRVRMGLNRALSYDWFSHKANDGKEIQTHGAQWYRTRSVPQAGVET